MINIDEIKELFEHLATNYLQSLSRKQNLYSQLREREQKQLIDAFNKKIQKLKLPLLDSILILERVK